MSGIQKKAENKVSYPITFHFELPKENMVLIGESGRALMVLIERFTESGFNTYKGRFIGESKTEIELEEFKGVTFPTRWFQG